MAKKVDVPELLHPESGRKAVVLYGPEHEGGAAYKIVLDPHEWEAVRKHIEEQGNG